MFGYVVVHKPEMKVKDFEIYNAIYCGLCRHIGKTYGALAKLCLNYDMTFVSLMQMALTDGCDGYEQKMCRANPLKKCTYCKNDSDFQDIAAAATMALSDLKVADNITDSGWLKSLGFRFVRLFTKRWRKKAVLKYPQLEAIVTEYGKNQALAEADANCSIDKACEPTAKAVADILCMVSNDEKAQFVLQRIGYCLGKWVYLCDVADDFSKDLKKGGFNPLINEYDGVTPQNEFVKARLEPTMNVCWTESAKYSELLDLCKHKDIVDNILYEGLKNRQNKIFNKETQT